MTYITGRCETCAHYDAEGWGCRQVGIRVQRRNPHYDMSDRAVGYNPRGRRAPCVAVGPLFGCVHWHEKETVTP